MLGVITLLAVVGIPNLFGNNERYSLETTARKIEQLLIEARTKSIAPTGNSATGYAQIFQVNFSDFPNDSVASGKSTAVGDTGTNQAALQQGAASCGTGVAQAGLVTTKLLKFPRNVYVGSFFPTNQTATDAEAVVRFSVGKPGFECGRSTDPIGSIDYTNPYWRGLTTAGVAGSARYTVIELASKRIGEKRYIAIDRLNGEVEISRTNPQEDFIPFADTFAPLWTTGTSQFTVVCRAETSQLTFAFPRAVDPATATDTLAIADRNRLVFYDIYWKVGAAGASEYQPLVTKHFSQLTLDQVNYVFNSGAITTGNQQTPVEFRVWAFDSFGNYSAPKDFSYARPTDWDCGTTAGGGNECTVSSITPKRPKIILARSVHDLFDLDVNPCVDDLDEGTGVNGQDKFSQTFLIPEIF